MEFSGKVWKFGDHINTDLILPGNVLLLPFEQQYRHAFSANRPGWVDQVAEGDILVGGHNFGTGSGRPAAHSLRRNGIACLIAESINGLFFRNCVNYGLFALECPGVHAAFQEGEVARVDFANFTVVHEPSGRVLEGKRFPEMLMDILQAGGIYPLLDSKGLLEPLPE